MDIASPGALRPPPPSAARSGETVTWTVTWRRWRAPRPLEKAANVPGIIAQIERLGVFARRFVLAFSLLVALVRPVSAMGATSPHPGPEPGSELRVFLLTMGPGDLVWEKFGHNALWIHDPVRGTDPAYNYGLFDFRQENFLLRFVQGRMLYWMEGIPIDWTLETYRRGNRAVWAQELNLTPRQKGALRDFLEWNERPENRFYRYDYYRDNCSTRIRDALDRVLGGQIRAETHGISSGTTYRWHTRRLTAGEVPTYTGLYLGLAQPSDHAISRWEEMFLPMKLREHVGRMTVRGPDGREVPLVLEDRLLLPAERVAERAVPPGWLPGYLLAGALLGGAFLLLGARAPRSRAARWGFVWLSALWTLLLGVGGVVLAGLWGFTDHEIAYRNENLLQFSPLALALVSLAPAAAIGARWAARPAVWVAWAVAGLSALGFLLQALPGFYQVNGPIIALVLPSLLGLALALHGLRAPERAPAAKEV
jgi:hypothetical protein